MDLWQPLLLLQEELLLTGVELVEEVDLDVLLVAGSDTKSDLATLQLVLDLLMKLYYLPLLTCLLLLLF